MQWQITDFMDLLDRNDLVHTGYRFRLKEMRRGSGPPGGSIIARRGTREKKFRSRLDLLSLEVSRYCRHLTGRNVRSFKELTDGRSPPLAQARGVRASRCVWNVSLARVRASVLQTSEWSDTSVRRKAAHNC